MTPGQIAYEAWMEWLNEGKLGNGTNWDYLSDHGREGWEIAAEAVISRGFPLPEVTR